MHAQLPLVLVLAFAWGLAVASFMQYTEIGRFLSTHLTWFMTALGSGGNLLLLLLVMEDWRVHWLYIPAVFFVSSVGPSFRGIWLHKAKIMEFINDARDATA